MTESRVLQNTRHPFLTVSMAGGSRGAKGQCTGMPSASQNHPSRLSLRPLEVQSPTASPRPFPLPSLTGTEIRLPDERPAVLRHGVCQRRRGGSLRPRQFIPQSPLSTCLGRQSTWLSSLLAFCSPSLHSVSQRGHYTHEATIQGRKQDPQGPPPYHLRSCGHDSTSSHRCLRYLPPCARVWLCFFAFLMRGNTANGAAPLVDNAWQHFPPAEWRGLVNILTAQGEELRTHMTALAAC